MASPPQIQISDAFLRTPQEFKDLRDVSRWAKGILRSLELQSPGANIGVQQGTDVRVPTVYPYTAQVTDFVILVDTGAARIINLPAMTKGFLMRVKDSTGNAAANNITINPHGAEVIDGGLTFVMATNYQAILMIGSGEKNNEWMILSEYP